MSRQQLWRITRACLNINQLLASPIPLTASAVAPILNSQRNERGYAWSFLWPGLAVVLWSGSELALAEEAPPASATPISNDSTAKWRLYTDQAAKLGAKGDFKRAEKFLKLALDEATQGFGPDDPHVAAARQNLAELYRVSRQYELAGPLYEEAVTGLKSAYGEMDARTAESFHNAAGFYMESGDAEKAQDYYEQAVQAKRAALGPTHPSVANSLLLMARAHRWQGDRPKAAALLQQHLNFLEENGQGLSAGALAVMSQLGAWHAEDSQLEQALPLLERVYTAERERDARSLATAAAAEALASVLREQGRFDEARKLLEESLSICAAKKRNVIPAKETLQLVHLELMVNTQDSYLRAHNHAQRCCEQLQRIWNKYADMAQSQNSSGWFKKRTPEDVLQRWERSAPHTAWALAKAYRHLAAAQTGLQRTDDAVASLQSGVDITTSPLLHQALKAAHDSGTSSMWVRHTPMEQIILDERASLLRDLLKLANDADEPYREKLAPRVADWQRLLDQTIDAARAHKNAQQMTTIAKQ